MHPFPRAHEKALLTLGLDGPRPLVPAAPTPHGGSSTTALPPPSFSCAWRKAVSAAPAAHSCVRAPWEGQVEELETTAARGWLS